MKFGVGKENEGKEDIAHFPFSLIRGRRNS
jgi:hypothetical protein